MKTPLDLQKIRGMMLQLYHVTGAGHYFDEPDVRIAAADDVWFQKYKTVIGDFHWTPAEALQRKFPGVQAKSVISWVIPVKESIRLANRKESEFPAVPWAAMRSFGELENETMGRQLCMLLQNYGYAAVSPHLEQMQTDYKLTDNHYASHWSERHIGFVAGHGTFGLSAGLITEHGVAIRLGSVVTDLELPATERAYGDDPWEWCTKCGACMKRCPAHAVGMTPADRDKHACAVYQVEKVLQDRAEKYGWMQLNLGCGLCQTAVPCEFKRP
ncbi:MAG: 4Fe-4S binding protein [Lentisphaeria bacterium]|nr:4Fe-4S binding protein [Lentisphaeria bacterium]